MSAAVLPCSFSRLYPTQSFDLTVRRVGLTFGASRGACSACARCEGVSTRFLGRRANSGGVGKAGKRGIGWEREKAAGSLLDVYKSVCTGNGDSTISSMHATCNLSPNMGSPSILATDEKRFLSNLDYIGFGLWSCLNFGINALVLKQSARVEPMMACLTGRKLQPTAG
ncbi:hypothetical protein R3P38DRAFT_2798802 [Favolaschia claudopus]|uniref:Uncharacterized protein n=1 Tax=Favolaschia claudopus TaxID=2862362 RepID=A0AAV9Z132_9AGAR